MEKVIPSRTKSPETPFRQFSIDGQIKKEFLPYKSSTPNQAISNEVKLANWGNMQQKLTAQNLDDIAQDIIFLKTQMAEEKQKIETITTKIELLDHLLHDST